MTASNLYNQLEQKQAGLVELNAQLSELNSKLEDIKQNPAEYTDLESLYDDLLDEIYSDVCEALPVNVSGSQLIKEFDSAMYLCGFSDFCSDYDYSSLDVYQETEDEINDIEGQITDLESEIEELEQEIEESEAEDE